MLRILMVPVIMGCAIVGTVGIIKFIKKVSPERFGRTESAEKRGEKNE